MSDFIKLSVSSTANNEAQYYVLKRSEKEFTVQEKAYAVALFETLTQELRQELVGQIGEDRAYLLEEYQRLAIKQLRETVAKIIKKVDDNIRSKTISTALDFVTEQNPELFNENNDA